MLKFFEFKKEDLDPIKSFHIKENLNSKVWTDFEINDSIREDLLQIGQDFFEATEIETDTIDIVFCGSLCNYNWSEYSDFDIHVIINYEDIDEDLDLVERYCDYAKKIWNLMHDITIKGYEVEVAIQNEKDLKDSIKSGRMGGVYSLMKNKWIKKPEKIDFEPDEKMISKKAELLMSRVDEIEDNVDKDNYPEFKEKISKVWKKIKDSRKSGLSSESGEYSIGNLVFKLLRRNGYISKIMDLKKYAYDKQFETLDVVSLDRLFYGLEKISDELNRQSDESWSASLEYTHDKENKIVEIDYSTHGYSEGFSDTMKIHYGETPIKVENYSQGSSPMGDYNNKREEKYNNLEEVIDDIRKDFGL